MDTEKTFDDIVYGEFMDDVDKTIQNILLVTDFAAGLGIYDISNRAIRNACGNKFGLLGNIGRIALAGSIAWNFWWKSLPLSHYFKTSCDRRGEKAKADIKVVKPEEEESDDE